MVKPKNRVTLICDDYARPTPSSRILPPLLDELNKLGVEDEHITLFVAKGIHRIMTRNDMADKFGLEVLDRIRTVHNEAEDDSKYRYLGTTSRGTPIWIHKTVADADVRIGVGVVEAHPYAGYGGGPKILVGAASRKTIYANHMNLATSLDAQAGRTNGNPCWMDWVEISSKVRLDAVIDVVLDSKMQVAKAVFGEPITAQKEAINSFMSAYGVRFPERADIVITSANPKYFYLDQCTVAILNSANILKQGGTLIVAAYCNEKLGPDHIARLYRDSMMRPWPTPEDYRKEIAEGRHEDLADAPAIYKLFMLSSESDLILVSEGLTQREISDLGLKFAADMQDAVDKALKEQGENAKIGVLPLGGMCLPYISQ